jgi:hypothetical protein
VAVRRTVVLTSVIFTALLVPPWVAARAHATPGKDGGALAAINLTGLKEENVKRETKKSSVLAKDDFRRIVDEMFLMADEISEDAPQEARKLRLLPAELALRHEGVVHARRASRNQYDLSRRVAKATAACVWHLGKHTWETRACSP